MPDRRLRIALRRGRLLVDAGDLADSYRARAEAYRQRADALTASLTEPGGLELTDVGRVRREARYYTPEKLGPRCPRCRQRIPLTLTNAGILTHPTCGPW